MNIIDGLQKRYKKFIESIITTFGWVVMLGYILQVILCILLWKFSLSNFYQQLFLLGSIKTTVTTLAITICWSGLSLLIMYLWGVYNYKKFAHLDRRKFPKDITTDDIANYFNLEPDLVKNMQNEKVIALEKTIV